VNELMGGVKVRHAHRLFILYGEET